ncbi:MAG: type IV secretion system protein TraC [Nitrospirota bacterium]
MAVPIYQTNKILQRYPLSEYLPYQAYDPVHNLFIQADGRCGVVLSSEPLTGFNDQVLAKFTNLFELDLPAGSTIQFAIHGSPAIRPWLDDYVKLREQASPVLAKLADRTRDFFFERRARLLPTSGLPLRDVTCYISVTIPLAGMQPHGLKLEAIAEKCSGIEQLLKSCGFSVQRLEPSTLLHLLHGLMNPAHAWNELPEHAYDPLRSLSDQAVRYDTVTRLTPKYLEMDGLYVKSLSIQQFPERWHGSMNRELIGSLHRIFDQVTVPFWISLNTLRLDPSTTQGEIRKKHLLITNQSYSGLLNVVPQLKRKKEHYDAMVSAMADGRAPIGAYFHILLWNKTPEEAEKNTQGLSALYRSLDWLVQEDHYIGLPMFLFSLPMGLPNDVTMLRDKLRRMKTLHTGVVPHLAPVVSDWKGIGRPVVLLVSRCGQLMNFDPFMNPSGNYNICVAAKSGSGKSFFTNEMIRGYLGLNARIWMIDAGRSYVKLCEQVGGQYIEFGKRHHEFCLNPLSSVVERDADEMAMLKAIFAQMASPSRALTDLEMSWIEEALNQVLDESGQQGTPTDVSNVLLNKSDQRQRDLGQMLYPYTIHGQYGRLFNRADMTPEDDRDLRFDNPFVVLELDGLDTMLEVRSVILLQLLFAIQGAMYGGQKDQPKICAMDEAWDLLSQGGNTATFFEKSVRRVRKYGGAIMTITQGINDYYDKMGQTGAALIENSDFLVLLQQKPESVESIKERKRLVFSEYEFKLLNSLHMINKEYSELYLYTPIGRSIARLCVDRYTQLYYTTKPDELARIAAFTGSGLSTEDAIVKILEEERAQAAPGPQSPMAASS